MYPRLEELMKSKEWDTGHLADCIKSTWWKAYHRRKGDTEFSPLEMETIANEMGVSVEELFKEG